MKRNSFVVMTAGITPKDRCEYVRRYLKEMALHAKKQRGCQLYQIHQSLSNPCEFMMYSIWDREEDFLKHNAEPDMQEFINGLAKDLFDVRSPKTYWSVLLD